MTILAGAKILASDMYVPTRHGILLRRVAALSCTSGVTVNIPWDTEDEDTDNYITVSSTTVTIPTGLGGLYNITYRIKMSGPVTGRCFSELQVTTAITGWNAPNTDPWRQEMPGASAGDAYMASISVPLLAGDSFITAVRQTSGGALNATAWLSAHLSGV